MQRSGSTQLVAEHDGEIIATARRTPPEEGLVLGEVTSPTRPRRPSGTANGFSIDENSMSDVITGGSEQAPVSKGGSGVAPDALAPLLLGPLGAVGLEARYGDALLGRQRDLMEALFPPVTSDLLTFYLAL